MLRSFVPLVPARSSTTQLLNSSITGKQDGAHCFDWSMPLLGAYSLWQKKHDNLEQLGTKRWHKPTCHMKKGKIQNMG